MSFFVNSPRAHARVLVYKFNMETITLTIAPGVIIVLVLIFTGTLGKAAEGIGGLLEGKVRANINPSDRKNLVDEFKRLMRVKNKTYTKSINEEINTNNISEMTVAKMDNKQLEEAIKKLQEEIKTKRIVYGILAVFFLIILLFLFF